MALLRRRGITIGLSLNSGFSQERGAIAFGAFAALVYGLISIGGYVGDHLLGTKRTPVTGAIVLAIGYFAGMSLLNPDHDFYRAGYVPWATGYLKPIRQPAL